MTKMDAVDWFLVTLVLLTLAGMIGSAAVVTYAVLQVLA